MHAPVDRRRLDYLGLWSAARRTYWGVKRLGHIPSRIGALGSLSYLHAPPSLLHLFSLINELPQFLPPAPPSWASGIWDQPEGSSLQIYLIVQGCGSV